MLIWSSVTPGRWKAYTGSGLMCWGTPDGLSFDHENGKYALTEIISREKDGKVDITISPRKGSYNGMPENRSFDMKIYTKKPRKITVNGKSFSASRWTYNVDKKFVSINVSEDMNKEKDISICLK